MSGKFKFSWADQKAWPPEGKDYVFLGDAILQIGEHMFPGEWHSADVHARPLPLPSVDLKEARAEHLVIARLLLIRSGRDISSPEEFNDDLWHEALAESARQVPAAREALGRVAAVREIVRKFCVQELLVSAMRWESDGTYHDLKPTLWTLPKTQEWFESGQIAGRDAFSTSSHDYYWLFIRRDGLDMVTAPKPAPPPIMPARDGYISPYMDLMFDVVREFSLNEENQSKKGSIVAYLEKEWGRRGLPDSKKLRDAMATMVRKPEAQSGGLHRQKAEEG